MIAFPLRASKLAPLAQSADACYKPLIADLIKKAEAKGGFIRIRLDLPSKAKTSPENRLYHALVGQLCMHSGFRYEKQWTFDVTKRYTKIRACAHGYPCDIVDDGEGRKIVEPKSVADASTTEVAMLIDACYLIAHEWGVELKQEGGL